MPFFRQKLHLSSSLLQAAHLEEGVYASDLLPRIAIQSKY
jgi:hypothetical protein